MSSHSSPASNTSSSHIRVSSVVPNPNQRLRARFPIIKIKRIQNLSISTSDPILEETLEKPEDKNRTYDGPRHATLNLHAILTAILINQKKKTNRQFIFVLENRVR